MRSQALGLAVLSWALTFPQSAVGQPAPKPPLVFGTDLTLVAVPVFVTDRDGRTVAGLTAADFEVEEGGKPTEIQAFLAVTGDGDVQLKDPGAGVVLTSRRQFVLLFDLALSRAVNIERARVAARRFVETSVRPNDLASVVVSTAQGMKTLLGLSPDRGQVLRAIDAVGRGDVSRNRDPLGIIFDMGLAGAASGPGADSTQSATSAAVADDARDRALAIMRQQRQAYTQQITQFLGGFQALARQLDAIRGRKNVILFSEGFDSSIISGVEGGEKRNIANAVSQGALWEVDGDAYFGSATGQNALSNMFASMRGSDVVVHAVDLGGAGADSMGLDMQESSTFKSSTIDSLATFAASTGGRFMKGASNLEKALVDIAASTKDYYVLAFAPTSTEVGKLRKVKVKVKRSGLNVTHRPAYLVPDPKKPDVARQALQASEIIAKGFSGGPIQLSAYALPYKSPQNGVGVSVVIQIPGPAFLDALKRKQINFDLYGYLVDETGAIRDFFKATPSLDPAALGETLKASGLQILTTFAATAGEYEVRLLARDIESQKFGALRVKVAIPESPGAWISAPMVTDDPMARVALPTVTERRPNREIPFRIGDRRFTVEASPVLKKGAPREICVFKTPSSGEAAGIRVILTGADGVETALPPEGVKVARDVDGFDRVVFAVAPKDLPAGDYTLKVSLGSFTSQASSLRIQ